MSTSKLSWNSSLLELSRTRKPGQNLLKLYDSGVQQIKDLLWILPLRIQKMPRIKDFSFLEIDQLFFGHAKVISAKFTPAFGRRGKGKVQLFNATVVVKDMLSEKYLNLKWFNTYPGLQKQLSEVESFTFLGEVQDFKGTIQIVNPKINPKIDTNQENIIEYPTINGVAGRYIQSFIQKIPDSLWSTPLHFYPKSIEKILKIDPLNNSFKVLHGLIEYNQETQKAAVDRIVYDEFLLDQLKVKARKLKNKTLKAPIISYSDNDLKMFKSFFPYELTSDQDKALKDILEDFSSGSPMMRMVQGDVGCGKTTVAILAALVAIKSNGQVAFMSPTEALALQHANTIKILLQDEINFEILLGSTKPKDKKLIYEKLKSGETNFVIGTHSLFQDAVEFKKLQFVIIDEQHKFGVEQRQKLVKKGKGTHSLIMTATPIPRTLQLAQFGDLEISTIRTIPSNRKETQTRIITKTNYDKYLSFVKTRISLGEQVYIVVPAISESETMDLKNVDSVLENYKAFFPDINISALHGQLKPEQKQAILNDFNVGKINLLISTSVIEVGIDVHNATVMAIYGPDRFGLSSLHQLRGRVGRGGKPGFCFLVTDTQFSEESLNRLKIIESSNDGFKIAEADLENRGQGDLFGVNQSGIGGNKRIASIFKHFDIFEDVTKKVEKSSKENPEVFQELIDYFIQDTKVSSTI